MHYSSVWVVLGVIIIIIAVYDLYTTTVTVSGSGPISKPLCSSLWHILLALHQKQNSHKLLKTGGPLMLFMLIITWFALCWIGWVLVFLGSEDAVINASTKNNASVWERIYFVGYTITTIGYGNFRALSPPGQFASIIAGFNGLFLVTLAITYTLPVVSSAVEKRKLALLISSMGSTTREMLDNGRGQGDFGPLVSQAQQLSTLIAALTEKHYAYPVLHYFHGLQSNNSLPLNLVRLSEAMDIVLFAFNDLPYDIRSQLSTTKRLIDNFMETLEGAFTGYKNEIPYPPKCSDLEALNASSRSPEEIEKYLKQLPKRRLLLAYIKNDGWDWEAVHPNGRD